MRIATPSDIDLLVSLMHEFYAEASYPLNHDRAREAFHHLLLDERLGRVWIIEADGQAAGYIVLTLTYSMEYGGLAAFVDDLYVRAEARDSGLGSAALGEAIAFSKSHGVRAVHLEVGRDNDRAQHVYRKSGFASTERELLTLRLAAPTHVT
jgi:ribosomal protein S18 acetylase RimI-like enzyme